MGKDRIRLLKKLPTSKTAQIVSGEARDRTVEEMKILTLLELAVSLWRDRKQSLAPLGN